MGEMTFSELEKGMFGLYSAGSYGEALDLVSREAGCFPDEAWRLSQWRVCLASRAGDTALAIRILQEALDGGLWYAEERLRVDDDLKPLQGKVEFERLVALSAERAARAQAEARPELVTLTGRGKSPRSGYPLLMALHGNTENAASSARFWQPAADRGWLVALAQSSQMVGTNAYVWDDHLQGVREVEAHYAALRERHALDPRRAVIGGFSMGGRLAAWIALRQVIPVRGFIALGPWVPEVESWMPLVQEAKGLGLHGTVIVGEQDAECLTGARALAELLDAEGIACDLHVIPGLGHDYPADFGKRVERALKAIR